MKRENLSPSIGDLILNQVATEDKDLVLAKEPDLVLFGFTLPIPPGKITFDATRWITSVCIYGVSPQYATTCTEDEFRKVMVPRRFKLNPFRIDAKHTIHNGCLMPDQQQKWECPSCNAYHIFQESEPGMMRNKQSFFCAGCAEEQNRKIPFRFVEEIEVPEDQIDHKLVNTMVDRVLDRVQAPDEEVVSQNHILPRVYAVYAKGKAPGIWQPTDDDEEQLVRRWSLHQMEVRPLNEARKLKSPYVEEIVGLGRTVNVGWVTPSKLQADKDHPSGEGWKRIFPRKDKRIIRGRDRRPRLV
jgi:hypothetical protein